MAKKRRPSPTEADIDRITESIHNLDTFKKIKDRDSFNDAYEDYMGEDNELKDDARFKSDVFDTYQARYELEDEEQTAKQKKAQEKRKSQRRENISEMVLARQGIPVNQKNKRTLNTVAYEKKGTRVVYAEETSVNVKGKPQKRLRDSRGRFASRKK